MGKKSVKQENKKLKKKLKAAKAKLAVQAEDSLPPLPACSESKAPKDAAKQTPKPSAQPIPAKPEPAAI